MRNRQTIITECPSCLGEALGLNVTCSRCGGLGFVNYSLGRPRRLRFSRRNAEVIAWAVVVSVIAISVAVILLK